jgi:hypothetical protein
MGSEFIQQALTVSLDRSRHRRGAQVQPGEGERFEEVELTDLGGGRAARTDLDGNGPREVFGGELAQQRRAGLATAAWDEMLVPCRAATVGEVDVSQPIAELVGERERVDL